MSTALEPMSFEELSELYRVEMKSSAVTQTRKDLFKAIANLLTSLRQDYDRQMALDPESIMCEGAEQRRKSAERLAKDVMRIRTQKICGMALRSATGSKNTLDNLTDEEKRYYEQVLEISKKHISEIDRIRGKVKTIDTRLDEIPEPVTPKEPEPDVQKTEIPDDEEVPAEQPVPEVFDDFPEESFDDPIPDEPVEIPEPEPVAEPIETDDEGPEETDSDLTPVLIIIKEDLPEFVGPHRDYRLLKEDVVTLPKVLADVLINTDKAVPVRPTP